VIYTAFALSLLVTCAFVGARFGARARRPWVAGTIAAAVTAAQFFALTHK
jgi:hypothetical protein